MLADELDCVIGVDPHRDVHTLALVFAATGGLVCTGVVAASGRGYREALALAEQRSLGRRAWAIEGTGSSGAGLTRFLTARGERVFEVGRLPRQGRRSRAKTDALDAVRAARSVLAEARPALPRGGWERESLRALMVARESALSSRRAATNQLRALLLTSPEQLRARLAGLTRARLLRACAALRPGRPNQASAGDALSLRTLARRVLALDKEEHALKQELQARVQAWAPQLLSETGVGPISATQILISWSHHGRIHSEAAFARLAATAPIPASSGQTIRHRLHPGGDRQLNRALHTITISRRKHHPETIAYITRRTSEGKSVREAIRCLKRYLARHLYRLLQAMPATA